MAPKDEAPRDAHAAEFDSAEGDRRLLAALRRGDEGAFETLVRTQGGRMFATARRLLPTDEDARDAVQEAFLAAHRAIRSFKGDAKISTWLHRIVVNAALMRVRYTKRRPEARLEDLLPSFRDDGHFDRIVPVWTETAEDHMIRQETREQVREKIDKLPRDYRNVIRLRDVEGLTTDEAAEALGTNSNVVKVRLHRARQALRGLLESAFSRESSTNALAS